MKELENNNVNQVIPVSEMDLQELVILINERYGTKSKPIIINTQKFNKEIKNKSPKWRYNSFLVLLNKFPRAWEYDYIPQNMGEKVDEYGDRLYKELNEALPVDIRNSGDEQTIKNYILQQQPPIKAKARLIKRLETLEKKKQNQELAEARKAGVNPFNDRPKFVVNKQKVDTLTDQQKNGRILLDVHMPLYQTSGNGCWSCSMQMLMQGRGVKNITQEDIRSYRPNYGKQMMQGEKFTTNHAIDKAFNTDDQQNVVDMGDAAVNLAPDSMLRTLDILKISDAESAMYKKFTPEEKIAYKKSAVQLIKKTIRKVLTEDKSPLSISNGSHYVTIVGIDGDDMLVKSSTEPQFDKEYPENIDEYVTKLLEGSHKCQLVWMTDINLAKDNTHFYGVPSETLELNPDGTYKMPPLVVNVAANANKAEQEYEGFRVRLYAGKEDTRNEQADRPLLVDGVVKVEQAYMPKKLNVDHLKEMAKHRPDIEEERLKNQTIELLGYDPTQKRPEKKQGTGKDYDIRGSFKLENIKEEEKREVFADDNFVTEKNKGKDGEKGDNVIDNREERTREKLFNPFSFSVGRDRDERIREAEERVNSAIGLNKKNHLPDVDQSGKQYIWNLPGADIAFRLEAGMNLARQVLTAMGPGKEKKLKEIEERYAKLKAKLNSPANKIKKEDNLSGYAGDGVILPSGLKIKGIFKDRVDRFEAVMLLDSITNSVSISENLHQQRLTEYTANSYNPSAISRAVENMQMICDYQDGNLLRGAGKNVAIKESIEKIQKFPENANLEELNKAFNNPDIQLEMTGYIVTGIEAKSAIDDEYRTANTQFVGPVPEVPKELEEPKKEEKKGREIAVADTKKKINFLGLRLSYKEFSEAMLKAGFDAGTTNAVFNIYNEEMVPYLDPVLGAEGNTVIDDEIQILALRGVVGNAGSVKGKLNKESLAHINSVIYRKTAKWEQEHGKKFETGDHSDYGFFGKGKKSEEEKLEFPWDETEEKKENKKKEKKEEIKDKEDKDKKEEGKENKEEKKEDKKEDKKEEGKNEEKKEETFDFEELVNDDYMQVFDEDDLEAVFNSFQLNKLNSEIDLYSTVEKVDGEITRFGSYLLHGQFKSKEEEEHMLEAYNNIGASKTRPAGILSLFTIWAMGELGHSYENAIRLLDKPDIGTEYLLSEFNKFCEENQVLNNEDNPEQFKKAVKNWTKLYKNATEKMKEYKIPDIDYFDKDALVKLQRELYMVSILGVNANQDQINPIFNEGKTITDTARNIAIEELGSEKAYMDMTTFWPNIQHVAGDYQSAYTQLASKVRTLKERKSVDYAKKVMCGKLYDYLLRTKLNMVRGKTFGEASEFFKIKGVLETETISNMISIDDAATEIPVQKFIDYGSGKNIKPLADEIQARKGKLYSSEKASRGVVIQKCLNDFRSNVNHNEAVAKAFLNAPDDAEGRREFLKKTDKNGVSYKTHITSLFAEITRPDCWNAITDTGYRVSGLFLIGGKTPEELWGRKYSHVENPEEKEWLLRSEIYKAAVSGDRDIQIRRFEIGADEKFKEKDIVTLLPSKHKAEKLINGIEHYKTAVQEAQYPLLSFKSIMSKYPDKKVQLAGLQKAVDRLSRTLDNSITGNDVSFETIKADFASLASAAGAYVMANQQDKSDVLYILANSVHGFVQQSSGIFNNIEKELSGNIIANSEHILNPPSFKWAEKAATEIENFYSKSISLNKETKHEVVQEIESVRNEIEKGNSFKAVQQKLVNGTNLTPDEVKVLNRKFDIIKQSEKTSELVALDQMKVMGGNEQETNVRSGIYKAAGFAGTRQDTMRSVYTLWLMGHKGYDLKSAIRILRSPDDVMINEFVQFCKDNPTNSLAAPGLKPDKYVAGAKKWAEVMKKSTELMKDYVIPDIDYSDPEAVREVFDEMEVIKGLSINAKQEFDRICDHEIPAGLGTDNVQYPGGTCREYVYEAIGGEPAYKEMTSIWRGSQSAYNAAYNAMHTATGAEYWNQGNAVMINRMLAGQAVNRYFLEKDFNKMKGMRFGEVPSSQIRITSMESDIREADIMAKIQFGEVNPDKEMVINYLTGKDKKAFESYIEKEFLNKKMEEAKKAVSPASVAQSFVRNVIRNSGQLVPLVSSLNDDKASKIEFAKNNKSIINGAFENIFTDASYRLAKEQGIDILDLVQIDGKTPEELWGETYKDINDPIEKRYLYKTELLKVAVRADQEIKIKSFKMDDEFNYIPHGMMLAVPKKTDVLKMGEGIDILNSTLDDIKSKVNMYYNRLKVTQGDQNNNFKNDVQEGSAPYREMCYCLARLSYYLGQRNSMEFSMSELRRRIDEFRNASEVYYKRGKTSNRERLIVAGDASKEMDNYLRVYDETFAAVDKGYPVNTLGTEIKDSSLSSIKQQIGSYFESYEKIGEMPRLTPEEITQKKAEMIERNNSLRLYEEKLNSVMGKKPDTTKKMSTDDVAKHVVYTNLINNVKRDGVTAEEIDGRTEMLSKTFFSDEVSALTSNKVFKEVAKKYQADTPKKWKEILQKSFDFGNEFSDFVNKRRGQEGINYIMTDKIVLSAKKNVKYVDKYDRLGEVVAKQILGAPRNPVLLQGLAAGQFEYKDLQKVCTEYLRKQDVLAAGTRNYLDNDALKTKLDNGTLKAEVLTKVAEPLKKVAEQRTRQEEIEKKNAEIAAKTKANIPSRK